ncbi:MAG: SDR family NAD(P)-dependent oxidoreductase, partial [Roseomonas sp.]|nr:SDR family NAD(P)-dependent oxidoreductase [Roseomonas sp.]
MKRLEGKVVWVTGAGSGIGEAAALKLAEEGATLILTGRRRAPLDSVASRITAMGGTAEVQPADLMDAAAVKAIGAFIA